MEINISPTTPSTFMYLRNSVAIRMHVACFQRKFFLIWCQSKSSFPRNSNRFFGRTFWITFLVVYETQIYIISAFVLFSRISCYTRTAVSEGAANSIVSWNFKEGQRKSVLLSYVKGWTNRDYEEYKKRDLTRTYKGHGTQKKKNLR